MNTTTLSLTWDRTDRTMLLRALNVVAFVVGALAALVCGTVWIQGGFVNESARRFGAIGFGLVVATLAIEMVFYDWIIRGGNDRQRKSGFPIAPKEKQ